MAAVKSISYMSRERYFESLRERKEWFDFVYSFKVRQRLTL